MTTHTHTFSPSTTAAPAAHGAVGELGRTAWRLVSALWTKAANGTRRSRELGRRLKEAAQARALADRCARTDHRMAADLYCAADRHEAADH
jgi:hypothetical protein